AVSLLVRPAQPFESIAGTPNQRNIANALDQAEAGANTALLSTVNAVSQLSVADARSAFERMSGDGWAYYSFAALQNADLFFDDIQVGNPSPERRRPAFTGP